MRVAIVHYWLLNYRGGEKVLEALCRLFPDADIFTLFFDPSALTPTLERHRIITSFLNPLRGMYRSLLPLMPMALESFDLRGYDLVLSHESGPVKGVLTSSHTRHVCYSHTPMRYLWDLYPAYRNEWTPSRLKRALMTPLTHYLRLWDYASAARVDEYVASSANAARRIRKTYRRECSIIHPPVEVDSFRWEPPEDYFLIVSELVAYKQIDSAVRAFAKNGRRLKIAGQGPEYRKLRSIAAPNIEFLGRVSDVELRTLFAKCRAFLMPGEEDFGITVVESLASGKPVIALARGGALETVPHFGGILYQDSLEDALLRFDRLEPGFQPADLQSWAQRFSEPRFAAEMTDLLNLDSRAVTR